MIKLKDILNEETILVRRVDSKAVETFLKKYPKVKQIMTTLAQKNTDLMRGYKAFLKFKDKQEPYLGGRGEETSSATFGSKVFYKYEFGAVKGGWPELYQYIYTLRYGGLDGAKVESVDEAIGREAMGIAGFTGTRGIAVQKFIDDFNLNAKKLFNFISKGKLKDRMDFTTAISGKPGNKYQGNFVGMFGESTVTEVTLQKGQTYGGTACKGGCYMGKEGLKKIIKISKDNPNNVFMFRDDNYSGLQPHFIKNGVIAKANTIGNPSYDLQNKKLRNLNIGKDVILSVRLFEGVSESITEAKSDYEVYHKSYTSAIQAAKAYAEKKGYEINDDDSFRQIGMGPRKPSEGKTNKFSIELSKDGKVQRKKLQIQVYGMKNSYELNAYIQ
jgi:hypothetical protein